MPGDLRMVTQVICFSIKYQTFAKKRHEKKDREFEKIADRLQG